MRYRNDVKLKHDIKNDKILILEIMEVERVSRTILKTCKNMLKAYFLFPFDLKNSKCYWKFTTIYTLR